ncbi:hypothetical protein D3C81_2090150 [compost metagenome]
MQGRENGEQQDLRHRQHPEAQVQAHIGYAELQRADHQHCPHEARLDLTPARQRQEHQPGQQHPDQYREIAVDVSGQVLADQAEGKRLNQCNNQ